MASKRMHLPQGDTPGKPINKRNSNEEAPSSRESLFGETPSAPKQRLQWTSEETSALVQYICLYWDDAYTNSWPMMKDLGFWNKCADAIYKTCKSSRTGKHAGLKKKTYILSLDMN
jgi:hypothetical protein